MNSEHHIKVMSSRQIKDSHDVEILLQQFKLRKQYHPDNPSLCSLSSSLTATSQDLLNCGNAEQEGQEIQKKLTGKSIEDASINRRDQAPTLSILETAVGREKKVAINPLVLFGPMTALINQEEQKCEQLAYELPPELTSLFVYRKIRNAAKQTFKINYRSLI